MNLAGCGTPAANPWLAFSVQIMGITDETPGVSTYELEFTDTEVARNYRFQPGQFNMLYLPGVGEAAISLSGQSESGDRLRHTVRLAGNVTHSLAALGVGGRFGLRGPFGTPWPMEECRGRDVVAVAGGLGLAPLRPAIDAILNAPDEYGQLTILYGSRTPEHQLFEQVYPDWRQDGAVVNVTVDRSLPGWQGHVGVVPLLVDRMQLPDPENTVFLICGPDVMMNYTVSSALGRGVPAERIWINMERNMNCAVGLCGHCQYGPEFICKDGPVLRYDRVQPLLRVEDL